MNGLGFELRLIIKINMYAIIIYTKNRNITDFLFHSSRTEVRTLFFSHVWNELMYMRLN